MLAIKLPQGPAEAEGMMAKVQKTARAERMRVGVVFIVTKLLNG